MGTVIHGLSWSFIKTANLELTKSLIVHTTLTVFGASSPLRFPSLFCPNPYPLAVFICSFPSTNKYGGSDGKALPAMQETRVRFLGLEDPLEKEMATHSSILAWKIPWTEEPGELQCMGLQTVRHNLATKPPQTQTWCWPILPNLTCHLSADLPVWPSWNSHFSS